MVIRFITRSFSGFAFCFPSSLFLDNDYFLLHKYPRLHSSRLTSSHGSVLSFIELLRLSRTRTRDAFKDLEEKVSSLAIAAVQRTFLITRSVFLIKLFPYLLTSINGTLKVYKKESPDPDDNE
jgi:N-glycosylase/DNA lyase